MEVIRVGCRHETESGTEIKRALFSAGRQFRLLACEIVTQTNLFHLRAQYDCSMIACV